MMSLKSKRELLEVVRPRYLKANKVEKQNSAAKESFGTVQKYERNYLPSSCNIPSNLRLSDFKEALIKSVVLIKVWYIKLRK